jgi:hypothetical protein
MCIYTNGAFGFQLPNAVAAQQAALAPRLGQLAGEVVL